MTGVAISRRAFLCARPRAPLYGRTDAPVACPPVDAAPTTVAQVAHVELAHCLSAAYQVCSICFERCGGRDAITLRGALPVIDEARCTGCGACADACPSPLAAIRMRPRRAREGGER